MTQHDRGLTLLDQLDHSTAGRFVVGVSQTFRLIGALPTAEPGPIMPFYFRPEMYAEGRWLDRWRDAYTRLVTRVFLHGLYRLSLTEFLLRR